MDRKNAALQLAIAVTRRVPRSDAIHGRDLVRDIDGLLMRAGILPDPDDKGGAAFTDGLARMPDRADSDAELVRALDIAVSGDGLPDLSLPHT